MVESLAEELIQARLLLLLAQAALLVLTGAMDAADHFLPPTPHAFPPRMPHALSMEPVRNCARFMRASAVIPVTRSQQHDPSNTID